MNINSTSNPLPFQARTLDQCWQWLPPPSPYPFSLNFPQLTPWLLTFLASKILSLNFVVPQSHFYFQKWCLQVKLTKFYLQEQKRKMSSNPWNTFSGLSLSNISPGIVSPVSHWHWYGQLRFRLTEQSTAPSSSLSLQQRWNPVVGAAITATWWAPKVFANLSHGPSYRCSLSSLMCYKIVFPKKKLCYS